MGLAPGHGVLGRICGLFRAICQETGIADRGGQSAGLVVLWFAIGGVRTCILVPAREWDGRIYRHASGRGGDFLGLLVYGDFVSLVQRDRLCGGDLDGLDGLVVPAVAAKARSGLTAGARLALSNTLLETHLHHDRRDFHGRAIALDHHDAAFRDVMIAAIANHIVADLAAFRDAHVLV